MKQYLLITTLALSFSAHAQLIQSSGGDDGKYEDVFGKELPTGVDLDTKRIPKRTTEWSYTYFRFGQGMTSGIGPNNSKVVASFGHLRFADSFGYGLDLGQHTGANGLRTTETQVLMGYRPQVKHRVIPYALVGFGTLTLKQAGDKNSGMLFSTDLGAEIAKLSYFFRINAGIRVTQTMVNNLEKSPRFTDLYTSIGFAW